MRVFDIGGNQMHSKQERDRFFLDTVKRIVKEEEYTIYIIANVVTGKKYVGLTGAYEGRISNHKSLLRKGEHFNKELQKDYDNYGESEFTFEVKEYCNNKDVAELTEAYYVENLRNNDEEAVYNKRGFASYKKENMLDTIARYTKMMQKLIIIIEALQDEVKKEV